MSGFLHLTVMGKTIYSVIIIHFIIDVYNTPSSKSITIIFSILVIHIYVSMSVTAYERILYNASG